MDNKGWVKRSIWLKGEVVYIIDQRQLPHSIVVVPLLSLSDTVNAIGDMLVRGAPLIGITAAFGMYLTALDAFRRGYDIDGAVRHAAVKLQGTRPTGVNLSVAVSRLLDSVLSERLMQRKVARARHEAQAIFREELARCRAIGKYGRTLISSLCQKRQEPINVLTHCNAGALACGDIGTATAPIYEVYAAGIPIHVWVSETRPRNQGAGLTAWELSQRGIPHTVVVDNACGYLMQHRMVDLVLVGADRVTRRGDAANKIGTYLKALAARDNNVPFYVAFPSTTIDWSLENGSDIPIEERTSDEVRYVRGIHDDKIIDVLITPEGSSAVNYGFDVTPSSLITGFITERGLCAASEQGLASLFF